MKLCNDCTWGNFKVSFVEHNNDFVVLSFEGESKMFRVKQAKWNSKRDGFEFRATRKHFVCTNKVEGVMLFLYDACHSGVSPFNRNVILDMLDWAWYNMDTVSVRW